MLPSVDLKDFKSEAESKISEYKQAVVMKVKEDLTGRAQEQLLVNRIIRCKHRFSVAGTRCSGGIILQRNLFHRFWHAVCSTRFRHRISERRLFGI